MALSANAKSRIGPDGVLAPRYGSFAGKTQQTGEQTEDSSAWIFPIRQFRIDLNEGKTLTESLFTRTRQIVSLSGGTADRWEGLITTPVLTPTQVRTTMNFLLSVGLYGRFQLPHPDYDGPSSGEEDCLVAGAGQVGTSLDVDGLTISTTVAEEGDWFQVGNEFKRLTADVTSNSSGEATLNFKPPLRVSPADNDPVELRDPLLLAELTTIPGEETDSLGMMSFTISFQEALVSA